MRGALPALPGRPRLDGPKRTSARPLKSAIRKLTARAPTMTASSAATASIASVGGPASTRSSSA